MQAGMGHWMRGVVLGAAMSVIMGGGFAVAADAPTAAPAAPTMAAPAPGAAIAGPTPAEPTSYQILMARLVSLADKLTTSKPDEVIAEAKSLRKDALADPSADYKIYTTAKLFQGAGHFAKKEYSKARESFMIAKIEAFENITQSGATPVPKSIAEIDPVWFGAHSWLSALNEFLRMTGPGRRETIESIEQIAVRLKLDPHIESLFEIPWRLGVTCPPTPKANIKFPDFTMANPAPPAFDWPFASVTALIWYPETGDKLTFDLGPVVGSKTLGARISGSLAKATSGIMITDVPACRANLTTVTFAFR